jgi:hypothetical protein
MAAITHMKSNTIGDMANTVTVFDSQGSTATVAATNLVRPGDWNSAHAQAWTISGNTAGDASSKAGATNIVFGGGTNITMRASTEASGATLWVDGPVDATLSAYQPYYPWTGSALSSHNPATTFWMSMSVPENLAVSRAWVHKSISMNMPAGTSSNIQQTFAYYYTHNVSLFKRKDYGASSRSMTYITHGSLIFSLRLYHTSTSMVWSLHYNTDSAGGTTSYSTTSNATANLVGYFTGNRIMPIPMPATTLTPGEYFLAQAHQSAAASTGNTATLLISVSNLHHVAQLMPAAAFFANGTQTNATSEHIGGFYPSAMGVANAHTSNADMDMSAVSHRTLQHWWINFINA